MNIPQSVGERLRYVGIGDGRVTWRLGISRITVYRGVDAVRIRKVSKVRYSASCIVTLVSINTPPQRGMAGFGEASPREAVCFA